MKNKIVAALIILFIITSTYIISRSFSNAYEISDLKENSILIGDDLYEGFVSPNKIISSSINYYIDSKDENPIKLYKYKGLDINNNLLWDYLDNDNEYKTLSKDGINKLELRRYIRKAKNIIDKMSMEELKNNSSMIYNDEYYFFETDLWKLNILSTKKINGYLVYKDKEVKDYNFDIDNIRYDTFDNDEYLEVVKVSDYGAKGDGITDDADAIQRAADYVNLNGGKLLFEKDKTYMVSIKKRENNYIGYAGIVFESDKKIVVDLNGSTIRTIPNDIVSFSTIKLMNCHDIIFQNGQIIGDRIEHDYTTQYSMHRIQSGKLMYDEEGKPMYHSYASFAHGITIKTYYDEEDLMNGLVKDTNVTIRDMEVSLTTGDGITSSLMTNSNQNLGKGLVILDNIKTYKNRRMGITLGENDKVIMKNIYIHDIGDYKIEETDDDHLIHCHRTPLLDDGSTYKVRQCPINCPLVDDKCKCAESNPYDEATKKCVEDGYYTIKYPKANMGIMPKAGIDIEPDLGFKTTNDVILDNIKIEKTTGFSLVSGKREFTNNFKIYSSEFYTDYNFPNAYIYNSYFEKNNSGGNGLHNCKIYNCEFLNNTNSGLNFNNDTYIYNSKINNNHNESKIYLDQINLNNVLIDGFKYISLTKSNISNTSFINNEELVFANNTLEDIEINKTPLIKLNVNNIKNSNFKNSDKININMMYSTFAETINENNTFENIKLIGLNLNSYNGKNNKFYNSNIEFFNDITTLKDTIYTLDGFTFDNVNMYKRYYNGFTLNFNNSNFKDSSFNSYSGTYTFKEIYFNNSNIINLNFNHEAYLNKYTNIQFNNSKIDNISSETKIPINLNNSEFNIENINDNYIINDKFICSGSNVTINNNILDNNIFKDSKLSNKCTINLNNYNNENKLIIDNKIENEDYIVNYNGALPIVD